MSKDTAKIEQFKIDLKAFEQKLMEDIFKKKLVINELKNVLIRREAYHTLDKVSELSLEYCTAFNVVVNTTSWISAKRNMIGQKLFVFEGPFKKTIVDAVEKNKVVIKVSDDFVWGADGRQIAISDILMTAFAFYYRLDGDAKKSIRKVKQLFEKPPFIEYAKDEGAFKETFFKYLYKSERFNRKGKNKTKPNLPA